MASPWDSQLSTAALKTSDQAEAGIGRSGFALARHLDLVVLALALPVFIAAGWPIVAYAISAVLWVLMVVTQVRIQRRIDASDNPRQVIGLIAGSAVGRGWLAAIVALTTGLIFGDQAGLATVLFLAVLFTVYFVSKMFAHALSEPAK